MTIGTSSGLLSILLVCETSAFITTSTSSCRTLPFHGALPYYASPVEGNFKTTRLGAEKNTKGVYARPSAAIERGSGFFIPGLEGPRVRLLFGVVLLVLTAVNRLVYPIATAFLTEYLAIGYAFLLLLQGAIEFGKDERGFVVSLEQPGGDAGRESLIQRWQIVNEFSDDRKEKVQWSAATFVALTPATQMILIQDDKVVYRLGTSSVNYSEEAKGCLAALATLAKAKSGRVAIPSVHQAAITLADEVDGRCVVLQTISENECWMMTSNQLLAAFTNEDLRWLGQLAKYVGPQLR